MKSVSFADGKALEVAKTTLAEGFDTATVASLLKSTILATKSDVSAF
jgi:hypothetical protein